MNTMQIRGCRYLVTYPSTPGATPTSRWVKDLKEARSYAKIWTKHRADLKSQDVRIERPDGTLVEYAGPNR